MNVVITLTTIPERLHNTLYRHDIKYCIDALLNINYDNYEIHFNIPETYKQTGEDYVIPNWLKEKCETYNFLKIFRTEDYGSITKLLPTINRIKDPNQMIITLDDDMIYHPEIINEHIKSQKKWPEYLIGYDGIRSRESDGSFASRFKDARDYYFSAVGCNSLVDILQAYKSISYKRSFFEDDFEHFIKEEGTWCDDTSISAYFAMKKRGRLCTFYPEDKIFDNYDDWTNNLRHTFPIHKYTEHGPQEGCNLTRANLEGNQDINSKTTNLYQKYIDVSYIDGGWDY